MKDKTLEFLPNLRKGEEGQRLTFLGNFRLLDKKKTQDRVSNSTPHVNVIDFFLALIYA